MSAKYFLRDQQGSVLVEVTIILSITLVLVLGAIDFLLLFYQWNAAAKAVQIGARLAAVSDPVASGLNNLSQAVVSASRCCHAEFRRHLRRPHHHLYLQRQRLPRHEGLRWRGNEQHRLWARQFVLF